MEELSADDILLNLLETTWQESASDIRRIFGLEAFPSIRERVRLTSEYISNPFGHLDRDGHLHLPLDMIRNTSLRKALVARYCFLSSFPTSKICAECIDDLSMEYARQQLNQDASARWLLLWDKSHPPVKQETPLIYHPSRAYAWLERVSGREGFVAIARDIIHTARNGLELDLDEYLIYFRKRTMQFSNSLESIDVKLLKYLIKNPSSSLDELGSYLGVTRSWTSRRLSNLTNRMILRRYVRTPFSAIGIRLLHILFRNTASTEDIFEMLERCPFLYSYQKVLSGFWDSLATFSVPSNPQSMSGLKKGLERIEKWGLKAETIQVSSSGVSTCFDFYSPEKKQWQIPWEILGIQYRRIHEERLSDAIPRIDSPERAISTRLDDVDIRILECMRKGITSIMKIRRVLQISQNRAAMKVKRLREAGLILPAIEIHNVGLVETVGQIPISWLNL